MKSSDFDPAKRAAAMAAAEKIRSSGFRVMSSGFGAVVVNHLGRSIIVNAPDADKFIADNTYSSIEDFINKHPELHASEVLIPENCGTFVRGLKLVHVVISNGRANMETIS